MKLSELDPNVVLLLFTAVTTVGGWLYHKIRGDKQEGIEDALWHVIEGNALKLAESDPAIEFVRLRLKEAALEGLARMGLKSNAVIDLIVAKLVERGVTEVRKRVLERKNAAALAAFPAQLDAMVAAAQKVGAALSPPANPTVPPLGFDVEIVPPTP